MPSPAHTVALGLVALLLSACEPARVMPSQPCTSSAHCPADGAHYCDLASGTCQPCAGPCPGANAPTNDTGPADTGSPDTGSPDTAGGVASDSTSSDATTTGDIGQVSVTSCEGKCGSVLDACGCDDSCAEFEDCCPDFVTFCAVEADAGAAEQ